MVMPRPMTVIVFGVRCSAIASRMRGERKARPVCLNLAEKTDALRVGPWAL
jgi:hypothetical protein